MSNPTSAQFKPSPQGLFSHEDIRRLMRIEFDRARRYHYPVVLLMVSVDRLGQLQDLYGHEVRDEILDALVQRLRAATRSSDFLGTTFDDQVLILVPHTPVGGVGVMARRMLKEARALRLECDGRPMRLTISVGGAHSERNEAVDFDTMLEVAQAGNEVAQRAGGDRYVHSELYDFFRKRREREGRVAAPETLPGPGGAPIDVAGIGNLIGDKIKELFGLGAADTNLVARIEREVTRQLLGEMRERRARSGSDPEAEAEYLRKIELLERRVGKLTDQLGMTEGQLKSVLAAKEVDPGLASVYSTVQGLSADEAQAELKKELMAKIFEANVELRRQRAQGS
jgi:diguanylate cyclase (GGDEF)-like protein